MRDDQDDLVLEVQLDKRPTRILIAVLGLALLCGVLTLIATQLGRPTATMEKVGTLADFPLGSVTRIQLNTTFTDSSPRIHAVTASDSSGTIVGVTPLPPQNITPIIFLVNDPKRGLLALYARDPHSFGCWVAWKESNRRFEDPCGGSKYTQTGEYSDGPAPRGLDRFGVSVTNDGEVLVNVSDYQWGLPRQ
jgi:cytochrome b6-f complex iron-sulfur subunit